MKLDANQRRAMLSWLFVSTMLVLCGVLGVLQFRWIGQVSEAARERLKGSLQANLERLSADFNSQVGAAVRNLLPSEPAEGMELAVDVGERYRAWAGNDRRAPLIDRISVIGVQGDELTLHSINLDTGAPVVMDWPAEWETLRSRMSSRLDPDARGGRGFEGRPPGGDDFFERGHGLTFILPTFLRDNHGPPSGAREGPHGKGGPNPFGRRELGWIVVALNSKYLRDTLIPEVLASHLGGPDGVDYAAEVITRSEPETVIYQSDPSAKKRVAVTADASIGLLSSIEPFGRGRGGRGPGGPGGPGGRGEFGGPGRGPGEPSRLILFVRHRAGSLEAVVSRTRWSNLTVTAGVLLLMLASVAALIRYTRRAQRLAQLQMDFVAGVSHELRTPLTVIHTAAYNLRGKLAANSSQVERYGALIQGESARLKELVEQVLDFASGRAGNVVQKREPLAVEAVIEEAMQSSASLLQGAHCQVETKIAPGLPLVLGDAMTLRHALQNLVGNAVKYGAEGANWVGISATAIGGTAKPAIEIRVADRGPGIPEDEQDHIFDPFFRGRRAIQDQIHGTGLGLSLVKQIVEAHGGEIAVQSKPMMGTEFVVRIPAAPPEFQDEFAHTSG